MLEEVLGVVHRLVVVRIWSGEQALEQRLDHVLESSSTARPGCTPTCRGRSVPHQRVRHDLHSRLHLAGYRPTARNLAVEPWVAQRLGSPARSKASAFTGRQAACSMPVAIVLMLVVSALIPEWTPNDRPWSLTVPISSIPI